MSRTIRIWEKPQWKFRMSVELRFNSGWRDNMTWYHIGCPIWRLSGENFGSYKIKRMRTESRRSIRSQNRTRLAHGIYEAYNANNIKEIIYYH